jgi:hypothetical protein
VTSAVLSANSTRVFKDSNSDGLPDYFSIAAGLDPAGTNYDDGPLGDPTHTGMSNYDRWIAGTFPPNPDSRFVAKGVDSIGTNLVIRWDGVAGRSYTVNRISNLFSNDWQGVYGPVSCFSNQPMSCADSLGVPATQRFYRVGVRKD